MVTMVKDDQHGEDGGGGEDGQGGEGKKQAFLSFEIVHVKRVWNLILRYFWSFKLHKWD